MVKVVRWSCVGLKFKNRFVGFFFFVGLIGVGKIELLKIFVDEFFGIKDFIIWFDMSEYMEKYVVLKIIGLLLGYVGYDEVG